MRALATLMLASAVLCGAPAASAWTRPAHMVTAAIAYADLAAERPDLLERIGAILDAHPDRGAFQVAIDRTVGDERRRRMFLQCARWPDDSRETLFDHPTWHAALRPVHAHGEPSRHAAAAEAVGEAEEAFALQYRVLAGPYASDAEKAVALCWVLHLAADIHQPLHAAQYVSPEFPAGDRGGGLRYVLDPLTGQPVSLHWFWDDAVHRSGAVADVDARTRELLALHPRDTLAELAAGPARAGDFPSWAADESLPLARTLAFSDAVKPTAARDAAPAVPEAHWREVRSVSERRIVVAGHRMAELVAAALDGQ